MACCHVVRAIIPWGASDLRAALSCCPGSCRLQAHYTAVCPFNGPPHNLSVDVMVERKLDGVYSHCSGYSLSWLRITGTAL